MDVVPYLSSLIPPFNLTTVVHPIMYSLSSVLLAGSLALQTAFSLPQIKERDSEILKRAVDSFIDIETPIAYAGVLCNIGGTGACVAGAGSGLVIAGPGKTNPDYFFTWTRDAALTFKALVDAFIVNYDADLQNEIEAYITAQSRLQTVNNPSGGLSSGGLAEPKYLADGSAFTGSWGRPQRDGPALRATALIAYSKWLIANGYTSTANDLVWPVIQNDLSYVTQYWNETGFDLWEEVQGSSFFTIAAQHRSLIEGSALAAQLGKSCPNCDSQAPQVLCFLQTLWNPSQNFMVSNINYGGNYRNGRDANTILASIHMFDPAAKCDSLTFQPCSDRALANHKAVTDSFRTVYSINAGIPQGRAVAVGRYSEDVYFGGNPWYLTTLAAAEQLYAALYTWQQEGSITVTSVSLPFFRDLSSSIAVGTYASSTSEYTTLINAVKTYADGYIAVIERYAEPDGSMAEQFSRNTGLPLSAYDLTWSYAAFLTAAARRAGEVPESWVNAAATVLPNQCSRTSANGPYAVAPTSPFPANQTPIGGVPPPTTTRPPCTIATAVSVTFRTSVTTQFGQTIKIVGSVAQLGNWAPANAITLSAREYTDTNNVWVGEVTLPAGAAITYKYINVASDGAVTWERDPNHSFTVPRTCATAATVNDSFQRQ